ncbi:hypothetical protein ACFFJX_05400 [Pseudarcicella hirudinis]|uniref:hypothetical protein n=1 Tax=Pseudarcicella hirudinis TaxID=1079859 RepID=UPI0035E8CDB5
MKKRLTFIFILSLISHQSLLAQNILGFDEKNVKKQLALEAQFDAGLNPQNLRSWMQRMTSKPHFVGSQHDRDNAVYERFISFLGL